VTAAAAATAAPTATAAPSAPASAAPALSASSSKAAAKEEAAPVAEKKKEKKEKKEDKETAAAAAAKDDEKSTDDDKRLKDEAKKAKEARDNEAKKLKDEEKTKRAKQKAADANDAAFGESADAEIAALDAAPLAPGDASAADAAKASYELFPASVYSAYGKLQEYARDLNTSIATKEIVFVGRSGDGKSSLIDAIVGERLSSARPTLRPIHFTLVQNDECTGAPRVTIKRDPTLPEYDHDAHVTPAHLASELDDRNREFTDVPIFVLYESAAVLNVTLIDLPGVDEKNAKTEALAQAYMKDTSRRIVVAEAAKDFAAVTMLDVVKKSDPDLSRTTFVFTKFHAYLRTLTDSRLLNRYLAQAFPEVPTYFVTLPSSRVPVDGAAGGELRVRVYQALRRDMALLEQLQHDKRHEKAFGAQAVRRRLLHHVWRAYQDALPRVLKHLRARAATTDRELRAQQAQLQALDAAKLRSIASHYVVAFLQSVARLLEGTCDANPAAAGETLADERREQGHDDWLDAQNRPIRFDPAEYKVPYADAKLYGGQQFERALAEFRAVMQHSRLSDISIDEVASAAGLNRLNNVPNYGWAASDIAAHKTRDAFVPLIDQLTQRVVYVVKRLATLSDSLIEAQRVRAVAERSAALAGPGAQASGAGAADAGDDVYSPEHYPYFTHHVKDLFFKFVDAAAADCKQKCIDEFYSTRTLYWHLSEYGERKLPTDRSAADDARKAVVELATELFDETRTRITNNVLLKFYNFFFVPLQNALATDLQGRITTLNDKSLEQLFHLSEMQQRLSQLEKRSAERLRQLATQDEKFRAAASQFAHPGSSAGSAKKATTQAEEE
jgi:GTPase SAR1 family protein